MDLLKTLLEYDFYDKYPEKHISASSFSKEPLEIWFGLQDIEIENKLSAATIGSLVHLGLEKVIKQTDEFKDGKLIVEQRIVKEHDGWTITGTPDLIDYENGILYDYKTGKNYSKKMLEKEGKYHSYAIQLAIYKWLIGEEFDAKILWLMKDSSAPKREPDILLQDVETMDFNEISAFITEKIKMIEAYGDNMPDKCKDLWPRKINKVLVNTKCKFYCSYNKVCPHYRSNPVEASSVW